MINSTNGQVKTASRVAALASALAITVASVPAWAVSSPEFTTVGVVEYSPGTLLVQDAGGNNFFAQLATQGGCTQFNQTIDTIKIWQSMAQSALLAGKAVRIYFNVCGNVNYIATLDVDK
jgi:hypothetical protein